MRSFVIGLLSLPVVLVAIVLVYWLGAMMLAVLGGIVAILCIAVPFVLKVAFVAGVLGTMVWGLGKAVSCCASSILDRQRA